jgi:nicotinamide-nucleotide amidase
LKGEIITIGSELVSGLVVDENSAYIAQRLVSVGIEPFYLTSVGDDEGAIEDALLRAVGRVGVVITSGGLGPTPDDITSRTVAKALGKRLVLMPEALEYIRRRYEKRGIDVPGTAQRQALMPYGSQVLANPIGTAPGYYIPHAGKHLFFVPGVPEEARAIVEQEILPVITEEIPREFYVARRVLKIFGLTESQVYEKVKDISYDPSKVSLGFLPVFPENHLSITARSHHGENQAFEVLEQVEESMRAVLGEVIFGHDDETMEEVVAGLLLSKGVTLAVAESLTGGLLAQRLTTVPGSSLYFDRGIIGYSNTAKSDHLCVDPLLISEFGAVSAPVAEAMARGIKEVSGTDVGVSMTGIAGPSGGSEQKPVGTVYIALCYDAEEGVAVKSRHYQFFGDRHRIRLITSEMALEWIRRYLLAEDPADMVH